MRNRDYIVNRSWAEVNLDAIRHNLQALRKQLWKPTRIMAVVKADAYGHGVTHVAQHMLESGADYLAVSLLDEAIELRQLGIHAPILILSYTDPRRASEIVKYELTQTVYSTELLEALEQAGTYLGRLVRVHIKVDTGMSRLGLHPDQRGLDFVQAIARLAHIEVEGIFTHFASADEADPTFTRLQFSRFLDFCEQLQKRGVQIPLRHCCNSAATLRFPEMHLDMVRPGLLLYGHLPDCCEDFREAYLPAMSLKSTVIMSKRIARGSSVSYGRIFTAEEERQILTIPIGYADGYSRRMSERAEVLIRGQRCPIVGRICMDSCMVDATELAGPVPEIGEEVLLFGRQRDPEGREQELQVEELATWADSVSYEMLCMIGKRVPRVYVSNQELLDVTSAIL